MPDDRNNRGAPDRGKVNIDEPHEVKYWTGSFCGAQRKSFKKLCARLV